MKKSRYPALVKVDGKVVCRGCGAPVPKGRQTWCSRECYARNCPQMVMIEVRKRDKHVCQICKRHIHELANEYIKSKPVFVTLKWGDPGYRAQLEAKWAWEKKIPNEEYDHIIPFSAGGKTVLENMRTVCSPCHKATPTYGSKVRKWKANHLQESLPI